MSEPGKRGAMHVMRAHPGINVMPLNDVLVFMYEHQVAPEVIREFTERTSGAVKELDEAAAKEAEDKKRRDAEWEANRAARSAATRGGRPPTRPGPSKYAGL